MFAATIFDCLRLLKMRGPALVAAALPGLLLSALALYLPLTYYLIRLESYLVAPSPRNASLALGAVGLSLVLWCLFQSMAAIAIVRHLSGRTVEGISLGRAERRMFGAVLRYVVLITAWGLMVFGAYSFLDSFERILLPGLTLVLFLAGGAYLAARMLMLAPAVIVSQRGVVLRRAWHLTLDCQLATIEIWLLLYLAPVLGLQMLGEMLLSMLHILRPAMHASTALVPADVQALRGWLPGLVTCFSLANGVGLILAVTAGMVLHHSLEEAKPSVQPERLSDPHAR